MIQIIVRNQALIKLNVRRSIISNTFAEVVQNRITELLWQLRLRTIAEIVGAIVTQYTLHGNQMAVICHLLH